MKTLLISLVCLFVFSCNQNASTDRITIEPETETETSVQNDVSEEETDQAEIANSSPLEGPVVYVTHEGDKYHTADCRYSKTAHAVKLSQAKADGKTACGVCKPNSKTGEKQARCSGKTAEGKRCFRTTTDASGKCFQHRDS
jgi:hypothetical protein